MHQNSLEFNFRQAAIDLTKHAIDCMQLKFKIQNVFTPCNRFLHSMQSIAYCRISEKTQLFMLAIDCSPLCNRFALREIAKTEVDCFMQSIALSSAIDCILYIFEKIIFQMPKQVPIIILVFLLRSISLASLTSVQSTIILVIIKITS